MLRRQFLKFTLLCSASAIVPLRAMASEAGSNKTIVFEVQRSDGEWRKLLSENQYQVLRNSMTEKPYVSHLNDEWRKGTYQCAGCELPVYSSHTKFESHTGWPSFYEAIKDATLTNDVSRGFGFNMEEICRRCGSHLGHIFDDGPEPTGLRHCINGLSLKFQPA